MIQTLIVIGIVLVALGYLGRGVVRTVSAARGDRSGSCGSGCGCSHPDGG